MPPQNRLARETSPYLQQHADNPVDWYPWGGEALDLAREHDKPILLSVGYSACHWCHVMAHESFEDPAVAALMNELYVNIKVDREERPDLDQIYQTAHAMLTQRNGGWPLTMFLMPDQTPFFGGTYFPRTARHNMPGFIDLLPKVAAAYRTRRAEIEQQNQALRAALAQSQPPTGADALPSAAPLEGALRELRRIFDEADGGLGNAPKFPHPAELEFCLCRHAATGDDAALEIARLTLTKMAEGGIYDQVGGGFCRYSVDRHWTIPHFEKMLYDNGPLLHLYCGLWLVAPLPLYARMVADSAVWAMREMQSQAGGGYYSSLDADSEHEEGKFYVWTPAAVQAVLSAEEYAVVEAHYGLDGTPNFEQRYWHLRVKQSLASVAQRLGLAPERTLALLDAARAKLLLQRELRVRPGRDDKILTSWNALMIKGMAHAARVFDQPVWLASARSAADFIRASLWKNGRLLATCKDGKAHLNAYLDDYAFLLDALIELMQSDFRPDDLSWACELAEALLAWFEDREHGGFFFVSHDHERLIHRGKTGHDNATPSGNGIAALALQRLGHILGEARYLEAAERTLKTFNLAIERQPSAHTTLCLALAEYLTPPTIAILRGDASQMKIWRQRLNAYYLPQTLLISVPEGIHRLPAALDKPVPSRREGLLMSTAEGPVDGAAVNAWVCMGVTCLPPIANLAELIAVLTKSPA